MFVQCMYPSRNPLGEAQLTCNIGTACTTSTDKLVGDVVAIGQYACQCLQPGGKPGCNTRVAEHKAQDLRHAAIYPFEIALEFEVICHI